IAAAASGSRGALSSLASRPNRSSISWRSCGVMSSSCRRPSHVLASAAKDLRTLCVAGSGRRINFRYATKRQDLPEGRSGQRDLARREKLRKLLAGKISVLAFTLVGERIELDQHVVDEAGMAHLHAVLGEALEIASHQ